MELTLSSWTHPKTGETRLYVNSPSIRRGHKVYIVKIDDPYLDCQIVWQAPRGCSRDEVTASRIAEELASMLGIVCYADLTFEMLESLAK